MSAGSVRPTEAPTRGREMARKLLHVAMGGFAFLLAWLDWWQAALCALAALASNLFLLPRIGGRKVFRGGAATEGHDPGIVLYPVAVLILVLVFHARLEIAAAAWAFLAFGDGLATIFGVAFGRFTGKLPWNRDKSWAGLLGFLCGGIPMAVLLYAWVRSGSTPGASHGPLDARAVIALAAVGVVLAILETLEIGINDNLSIPLAGGALAWAALLVAGESARLAALAPVFAERLPWALGVNLAVAAAAYAARSVDVSGFVHGVLLGTAIWTFGGPGAFGLLLLFFVTGTVATKVGYRTKAKEGTAQEKGGRRGAKHAWANVGGPMLFILLAATTPYRAEFALAFVAALATATSDTLGSEIGQAFGRRTFLITTFRPVPRGTDGAVSLEGTLAGIAGSLMFAVAGFAAGLCDTAGIGLVVLAAFAGTTLESYLGAVFERAQMIDNEAQNFLNTVAGGLCAIAVRWVATN